MSNTLALPINLSVGTFNSYLGLVNQMPKLTAEQEMELAIRYRKHGDVRAARTLVMSNLGFVAYVARGYSGYGLPLADVMQEGNIGLMKAVKRFNPDVGVRLVSFAIHWIRAEIHEYVIKHWRIVKVATTKVQRKLFFNLRKSKKGLGWLSKDDAEAIAENLDVDIKSVYVMEGRLDSHDVAFDLPSHLDDDSPVSAPVNYLEQHGVDPALLLENADWKEHKKSLLTKELTGLDKRSQDILSSRWLSEKKLTLHDLAARYNISAERVRQLEQNAINKLKTAIALKMS